MICRVTQAWYACHQGDMLPIGLFQKEVEAADALAKHLGIDLEALKHASPKRNASKAVSLFQAIFEAYRKAAAKLGLPISELRPADVVDCQRRSGKRSWRQSTTPERVTPCHHPMSHLWK